MKSYEKIISERIKEQRKKKSQKQQRVNRLYGIASILGGIGLLIYALLSYQAVSNLERKGFQQQVSLLKLQLIHQDIGQGEM